MPACGMSWSVSNKYEDKAMNRKLGGELIGYAIEKKNGEFNKVIFDRPIHNTITKSCLNNLLMFNGDNTLPSTDYTGNAQSLFIQSTNTSERYGVFNFCALGDGTGATSVNDTALKNRVSDYSSTFKTGADWFGTTIVSEDATVKYRISHVHTIAVDMTIREIGWFNRIYPDGAYTLSSRVVLDNPISVETGDTFYSIYEIAVGFQDIERFYDFGGTGVNGYSVNGLLYESGALQGVLLISNSGSSQWNNYGREFAVIKPIYLFDKVFNTYYNTTAKVTFGLNKGNWDKQKAFIYYNSGYERVMNDSCIQDIQIKNYTLDSFYRDADFSVTSDLFINQSIYGIFVNGTYYRFGDFDASDNFTPQQVSFSCGFRLTFRQSWSTDLLTPAV